MKISKKIIYTSILISLLTGSYTYTQAQTKEQQTKYQELVHLKYKEVNINDMFTIEEKHVHKSSKLFEEDIKYPYLKIKDQYIDKENVQTKIIKDINNKIEYNTIKFADEIKNQSESDKKSNIMKYQYQAISDYKVAYNKNNIISIPITQYQFTGGAHGLTFINSYNYNLANGKEIKLKDLFKENSNYKEVINNYINQEIEKNKSVYFSGDAGFKGISDDQNFYIEDDGIMIYFTLYDIAPYSTGIPQFKITWDQIIDYLENPNISK